MPRISRFHLVFFTLAIFILVSVPLAGARPLETSPAALRIESGWFATALRWLGELAESVRSTADRTTGSPEAMQKDGNGTTGGPCIDPHGHCNS